MHRRAGWKEGGGLSAISNEVTEPSFTGAEMRLKESPVCYCCPCRKKRKRKKKKKKRPLSLVDQGAQEPMTRL